MNLSEALLHALKDHGARAARSTRPARAVPDHRGNGGARRNVADAGALRRRRQEQALTEKNGLKKVILHDGLARNL